MEIQYEIGESPHTLGYSNPCQLYWTSQCYNNELHCALFHLSTKSLFTITSNNSLTLNAHSLLKSQTTLYLQWFHTYLEVNNCAVRYHLSSKRVSYQIDAIHLQPIARSCGIIQLIRYTDNASIINTENTTVILKGEGSPNDAFVFALSCMKQQLPFQYHRSPVSLDRTYEFGLFKQDDFVDVFTSESVVIRVEEELVRRSVAKWQTYNSTQDEDTYLMLSHNGIVEIFYMKPISIFMSYTLLHKWSGEKLYPCGISTAYVLYVFDGIWKVSVSTTMPLFVKVMMYAAGFEFEAYEEKHAELGTLEGGITDIPQYMEIESKSFL